MNVSPDGLIFFLLRSSPSDERDGYECARIRAELAFAGKTAASVRDGFPEDEIPSSSRDPYFLVGDSAKSTHIFRRLSRKASVS